LGKLRRVIKEPAPETQEIVNYGTITLKLNGNLVHFAAFKNHIGFYSSPSAIEEFKEPLLHCETSKGAIKFPLDKPITFGIIEKMVIFRVNEVSIKGK